MLIFCLNLVVFLINLQTDLVSLSDIATTHFFLLQLNNVSL